MKRTISLLISLVLLMALLPGCAQSETEADVPVSEPEVLRSARELADMALPFSGHDGTLDFEYLNGDEDGARLATYIEAVCGLAEDQWEDAAVIRGTGASAFEIVVLRLGDEEAAGQMETVLTDYLTVREGAFTGYAPAEAEMASNGKVRREGRTLGLFICPDPEGAADAFTAACNGEELPALPEPEPVVEPVEEADDFTPMFELRDLLHRILLEAACPEWGGLGNDRGWSNGGDNWAASIEAKYGITADQYEDCGIAYWGPQMFELKYEGPQVSAEDFDPELAVVIIRNRHELALFRTATEDGALELVQALNSYKAARLEEIEESKKLEGAQVEDLEAEAAALEKAVAVSSGHYAALITSEYVDEAVRLFPRAVNDPNTNGYFRRYIDGLQPAAVTDPDPDYPDRVRFTPPGEEDMSVYDTSAILAAWEKGDPSGLSGDDAAIYTAAEAVLAEILEDGMTDLEKEIAAYRWLVENVDYDWSHMDILDETARRAYGPYGGLVDRSAVCLGYAASFQLLMDMCGVECITVVGAAFNSTGDHAWNQVKLNGEWYCVDVTWDANGREQLGGSYEWRYLNLTSDEMAENHQWDYANTPEATAEDQGGAQ